MLTPDFMPVLKAGPHKSPEGGACVMEYISVLAGEDFTDLPSCTHTTLACAAQEVNDSLEDEDRHLLIPLISRLMRTGRKTGDARYDGQPLTTLGEWRISTNRWWNNGPEARVKLLDGLIDGYWRKLGEPEPQGDDLTTADYELMVTAVKQ